MTEQRMKTALTGLQWTLGLVILIEAILFVMPSAGHDFARTHMPDIVRLDSGMGRDRRLRAHADSANRRPRRVGSGGYFCAGDFDSPAARHLSKLEIS